MEMKVIIELSNRHVHLTKETYDKLFDNPLTVKNYLSQTGQFAANETVTIEKNGNEIKNVRIIGPLRKYDQVEVSHADAFKVLKCNPPVRASGDLNGAESIIIKTDKGQVEVNACIISQRHVHLNTKQASLLEVKDKQKVCIKVGGDKSGIMDVFIKVSDDGVFRAHIDTDDAHSFLINNEDEGILII